MQTIEKKENIKIEATQWVGKIAVCDAKFHTIV